jgi:hypothetical protein
MTWQNIFLLMENNSILKRAAFPDNLSTYEEERFYEFGYSFEGIYQRFGIEITMETE